jgi:hypothetical protein
MKRTDNNHADIVKGLRAVGAVVQSIAGVGKGTPDLLIAFRGRWYVAEVKDGKKPRSQRKLTPAEQDWHEQFGRQAIVHTVNSLDEALEAIGAINSEQGVDLCMKH